MRDFRFRGIVWFSYLLLWSAALLTPHPSTVARAVFQEYSLMACKILHVSAYGVLAALTGWLAVRRTYRWPLLGLEVCHSLATEYLQHLVVSRTASWRDVGLNLLGLALGLALSWKWWFGLAQAQPVLEGGGEAATAASSS